MTKVAINGMGRIGRAAFKIIMDRPELELVAVNDLMDLDNLVYLLNYDTVYGVYKHRVTTSGDDLVVNGKSIKFLSVKDPAQLPWKDLGVEIALECTGLFTQAEGLSKHLAAGAKYAMLSAPPKGAGGLLHRPRRHPAGGRRPHDLLRLLHHQLHHPGGGDHGPADRRQKGGHDHHPRLHLLPGHRGRTQQEISPGPGRGGQPGAHLHRAPQWPPPTLCPSTRENSTGSRCAVPCPAAPWRIWCS